MRELPKHYKKGRFIGKGGFARCYELKDTQNDKLHAVKIVSKQSISKPRAQAKLKSEISIHRSLNHEKVIITALSSIFNKFFYVFGFSNRGIVIDFYVFGFPNRGIDIDFYVFGFSNRGIDIDFVFFKSLR